MLTICCLPALSQTTAGTITGRVIDEVTRTPIAGAAVSAVSSRENPSVTSTDSLGRYWLQQLEPATYSVTVEGPGGRYRTAELQNLVLPVSGVLVQDFEIRMLDNLWQSGQHKTIFPQKGRFALGFFGPDADFTRSMYFRSADTAATSLIPAASAVIGGDLIRKLPLAGRDTYSLLALQPGVASGLSTLRGVSLSAAGQRPSSSVFYLDGFDNSNSLISGPLVGAPPESVQEYRLSIAAFSAEYGGTSGFVANAALPAGSAEWHGLGYAALQNTALNANDFQRNWKGQSRIDEHWYQGGFQAGGPLRRKALFAFASWDRLKTWAWDDGSTYLLPTSALLAATTEGSAGRRLLSASRDDLPVSEIAQIAAVSVRRPSTVERTIALGRIDWIPAPADRITLRGSFTSQPRPDFVWSPYPNLTTPLQNRNTRVAAGWTRAISSAIVGEFRAAWDDGTIGWDVDRQQLPFIPRAPDQIVYPGSPANYSFLAAAKTLQLRGALSWAAGNHSLRFGAAMLRNSQDSFLTRPGGGLEVSFASRERFLTDLVRGFRFPTTVFGSREYASPRPARDYRYTQWSGFVQDSIRLHERLLVYLGARYEYFQPPSNQNSTSDYLIQLADPGTIADGLRDASLTGISRGDFLFAPDRSNWAARTGVTLSLRRQGATLLHAAYGIFYDRPFDNLWQTLRLNDVATAQFSSGVYDYFAPPQTFYRGTPLTVVRGTPVLFQPGFRTPYAQHLYANIEHRLGSSAVVQAGYLGALGRRLLTTDVINRRATQALSPHLRTDIDYRANQGLSNYHAAISALRVRTGRLQIMAQYTLAHSIDNQSEALSGLWTLNLLRLTGGNPPPMRPAFTAPGDSRIDRASSDFDQRHTFGAAGFLDGPSTGHVLLRSWIFSWMAAIRSGTPWNVYAFNSGELLNVTPDYTSAANTPPARSYDGGRLLANYNAFSNPAPGRPGSLRRNSLAGPGMYSVDAAISRTIRPGWLPERAALEVRMEAYNVLNHTNLANPSWTTPGAIACCVPQLRNDFAAALYGREENPAPMAPGSAERARRLQLFLRFSF